MKKKNTSKINLSLWLVIGFLGVLAISGVVLAAGMSVTIENCQDCFGGQAQADGVTLGGTRFPSGISADSTSPSTGEVRGTTLTSTGATTVGTTLGVTGVLSAASSIGINATNTATTVLDMLGTMRTYTAGVATTTCDTGSAGAMMYSTGTAKLMGCDGSTWQALW